MDIIRYPIKNYQFTLVIVLMVVLVGANSLMTMPRAEDPDMKAMFFPVAVVYPGASPKDMEQLVVKPLETRFYGLDQIKRIRTDINNGIAVLSVEYEHKADYDTKYQELIRELGAAVQEDLPEGIYSAEVLQVDPSDVSVIQVALISENAPRQTMNYVAEELKSELEKVKALKKVTIHGMPDQLVRVDVHPGKLAQMNLPVSRIMDAIGSEAANIPGGRIHAGQKSFSVTTSGNYQSIDEIRNTIVSSSEGKNVLLSDVADVYPDFAPQNHIARLNGYRSVFVTAAQKTGMNISDTQKEYQKVLTQFKENLPSNVDMVLNFDQAVNVNKRLNALGTDLLIAIGLVLITLLPLGLRASTVVMIAIPLSLAIGIVVLNIFGFSLNQLSIVGFVVALGLVVDDSIVVIENIERWMREGHSRLQASIKGTKQIVYAVLGCTATLIVAFLPLMFMPDEAGDFVRSMPAAVIGSVTASMFVALFVVPLLASRILKPHENPEGNAVLRVFQRVIHITYAALLDKALKKPAVALLIAGVIFIGSVAMIPVLGFSLFPESEKPQFLINITPQLQSNIYHSDSIARIIETDLAKMDRVKYYSSNVGKGNPRIYYNLPQTGEREDFAQIFVQLHDDVNAKEKLRMIDTLRRKWDSFLGARVEVRNFEQGVPTVSPVEVRLFGDNLDTLQSIASGVEELLRRTDGTIYVNNPVEGNKTDLRVVVNREKALALGVPTISIDRTIRMALAGLDVANYSEPDVEHSDYKIRVSVPRTDVADMSVFNSIYVDNVQGTAIPLSQIATIEMETSPPFINRTNKVRTVSVNSFVQKGFTNDKVISDVEKQMEQMQLPRGYHFEMGGEVENREEAFTGFGTIILVAVFLFIAVLVLEFKTLKSTIIVLSVIPLGIVGAVAALWITGNTLSFVATIGLVALAGIEVKNTILLVDFTNQLRAEGVELVEAIERAGEMRFLPIVLTALTAIGGLLPIAWSSNPLISPLAIVIIGGLISSTFLSRIVTPVVYLLMPPKIREEDKPDL